MALTVSEFTSYIECLYLKKVDGQGQGVFTNQRFHKGDLVLFFGGEMVHAHGIDDFTHYLQIGPDQYPGPSGNFDDYVNHNCNPNCAVYFDEEHVFLKAIKDIYPGQQLSLDYGTIQFNEPTIIHCECGSRSCRKTVGNFYSMPKRIQDRYLSIGLVPLLTRYTKEELGFI